MSLFFDLLPADLQIDILSVWLNPKDCGLGLLRVLSAMDMACAPSCRQPFLWLIAQIPAFGEQPVNARGIVRIGSFLKWLNSRKVALTVLVVANKEWSRDQAIDGADAITLPAVERICWTNNEAGYSKLLTTFLRCCPNLTSMDVQSFNASSGEELLIKHVPKLREINVLGSGMVSSERVCFPQLRVLRLKKYAQLGSCIATNCPSLVTLEALSNDYHIDNVVNILGACSHLSELMLHGSGLSREKIAQLLAFKHIKRLTCQARTSGDMQSEDIFVDSLGLRPDLQYLQVNRCSYSPADGILHVTAMQFKPDVMRRIFNLCAFVSKLVLNVYLTFDCATLIAGLLGNNLKAFSTNCPEDSAPLMSIILQQCGNRLTSLELKGHGVDDQLMQVVGQHCPLLESLHFLPPLSQIQA